MRSDDTWKKNEDEFSSSRPTTQELKEALSLPTIGRAKADITVELALAADQLVPELREVDRKRTTRATLTRISRIWLLELTLNKADRQVAQEDGECKASKTVSQRDLDLSLEFRH